MTLPAGWVIAPLGQITEPSRPRHAPSLTPELPFIGMEHVEAHSMRIKGTVPAGTMKSAAVHFQPGDVLYGRLRPYLNKVVRPAFEGLCSAEFIVFPPSDHLDSAYLQYVLHSAPFVAFATRLNAGDRPRVDFEQISSYEIPLPPLNEQRRIVAAIETHFSQLNAAVEGLERVGALLARFRASIVKRACEPGTAAGKLSKWELTTIGAVALSVRNGISLKPDQDTGQPILRISAVRPMQLDSADIRFLKKSPEWEPYGLQPGDLLFTRYNGNRELVGCCAMVKTSTRDLVYPDKLIRIRVDRTKCNPAFLEIAANTGSARAFIRAKTKTTAGQTGIAGADLKNTPILLPPISIQEAIAAEVESQLSIAAEVAASLHAAYKRATRMRQSILHRAFMGSLAAQDPNDEPARELSERICASVAPARSRPRRGKRSA